MATITSILPNIMTAIDVVASEPIALTRLVGKDISGEMVAKGQTVRSIISGAKTAGDSTPSATLTPSADSVTSADIVISKDRSVVITSTGDEETGLGSVYGKVLSDDFAQAFRTLRNEVETDLSALYADATIAALGTAGTTPFASDIKDIAKVRKALISAGAPADGGYCLVVDPSAYANLIGVSTLIANASAAINSAEVLSGARLPMIYNTNIGESAQIATVTGTPNYAANMFFHRSAIQLVARAPKYNSKGDAAIDRTTVTDPVSGLTFVIAAYAQHRQISYEVGLAWGVKTVKPAWLGVLKG